MGGLKLLQASQPEDIHSGLAPPGLLTGPCSIVIEGSMVYVNSFGESYGFDTSLIDAESCD